MFAFAMVTGVKNGWLPADPYGVAARKAWLALVQYLDANGNVRDVCVGTGEAATSGGGTSAATQIALLSRSPAQRRRLPRPGARALDRVSLNASGALTMTQRRMIKISSRTLPLCALLLASCGGSSPGNGTGTAGTGAGTAGTSGGAGTTGCAGTTGQRRHHRQRGHDRQRRDHRHRRHDRQRRLDRTGRRAATTRHRPARRNRRRIAGTTGSAGAAGGRGGHHGHRRDRRQRAGAAGPRAPPGGGGAGARGHGQRAPAGTARAPAA